jgi:hypothetical protein
MRIQFMIAASAITALLASACGSDTVTSEANPSDSEEVGVAEEPVIRTIHALDSTGTVDVSVTFCQSPFQYGYIEKQCQVTPGYWLVGGGAQDDWSGPGAMLVYSKPCGTAWQTWCAASKDHSVVGQYLPDYHRLTTYAVGLKLKKTNGQWTTPSEISPYTQVTKATNPYKQSHPTIGCSLSADFIKAGGVITGGGAEPSITAGGAGQLLTASYSPTSTTWYAASKDHSYADSETISAYCIGIKPNIAGFGTLSITSASNSHNASGGWDNVTNAFDSRKVALSYGARLTYNGSGRLLYRIGPADGPNGSEAYISDAASKDHGFGDGGFTYTYATLATKAP